ncbi:hypothetical protein JNB_07524 [Janibacter sp. HTCC2649]|uniref:hypothetical protein n=1 Tax=Janibacter sp. HTCC2649 TaxID=313589 RepID=UPI0000670D3C|nr:hypothetical protein [Janibacter sp. HTCC2649]EAQ00002.1 hypothetical protein JNB_07524 [Janibacter sp. HTCC2649]
MSDPILELLAAPPNPSMVVDETAVYAGGRRRLRRRTLRRSAVGVVGVVGVAAIAFGALGTDFGTDALPAGPSPTASSSGRVSAELLDGRYAVEVIPGAGKDQPNVIFSSITNGKRTQLAGSSASSDVVSLGTGSGADGVMLGTAPAGATGLLTITRPSSGGIRPSSGGMTTDQQRLPGTDYQAIALDFEKVGDVSNYVDTIWMNTSGEVRDARGNRLPSTAIGTGETFFVAHDSGVMGVFNPGGGSTRPLSDGQTTTLGTGEKADGGPWAWRSVTLLPEGSKEVSFEWVNADSGAGDVITKPIPGGVVAWAQASAPSTSTGPTVRSVTWLDVVGTRHTEVVK